jgi:hypothetical protein
VVPIIVAKIASAVMDNVTLIVHLDISWVMIANAMRNVEIIIVPQMHFVVGDDVTLAHLDISWVMIANAMCNAEIITVPQMQFVVEDDVIRNVLMDILSGMIAYVVNTKVNMITTQDFG